MKNNSYILKGLAGFTCLFFLFSTKLNSQTTYDSLKLKLPKHYFNTLIVLDSYRKPNREFKDTSNALSKRLKSYGIKQFTFSFLTPVFTKDRTATDGTIQNSHLLLTANFLSLRPVFDGLGDHNLVKFGVGMRFIYNTGKKGVWFADVSPFVTRDITYPSSKPYYRLASTLVYSHNVNDHFNWRLGITKSFMWGNRFYWPFIGLRVGRLDKVNVSVQFPRSASLNVPMGSKVIFSFYTRPQGGLFNFSNADSLYYKKTDATFHFTRRELNTGVRFDIRVSRNFNFYLATGLSTGNTITFYSENANRRRSYYSTYFYRKNIAPSLFFNFGFVLKFGKTRSYFNNKNIYDAVDLNTSIDPNSNGNAQIPLSPKKKKSDLNLKSVEDLVDYNDF
ncbi:hypothetical protein CNR22_05620 [Sphingobacteriaceae bacterium]|nr:hypothetical protein CNR22_05620 [Sphingobacteriaceae bacterium]